ncbi:MAG: hypothetical protein BWY86_00503 [Candidatus Aminicenantes bacterium ADurb.Bin508]|nr:MAG: hypothetical protein BWY86_00503 [Candidatus Aminicenantes bacterium ADurb.Bin508]
MAEGVVHSLEVVHIDHHDSKALPVPSGEGVLLLELLKKVVLVEELGHPVCRCRRVEVLVEDRFQLGAALEFKDRPACGDDVPTLEGCLLLQGLLVEKGPVQGAEILKVVEPIVFDDSEVFAGHEGIVHGEVVLKRSPSHGPLPEFGLFPQIGLVPEDDKQVAGDPPFVLLTVSVPEDNRLLPRFLVHGLPIPVSPAPSGTACLRSL